jgi:hypothetical protein
VKWLSDFAERLSPARFFKNLHLFMTFFWAVMVPVSMYTGLDKLVRFITFLSLWALVVTHWGAWQASRAEVRVETAEEIDAGDVTVQNANRVDQR